MRKTVAELRPVLAGDRGPGGFRLETPPEQPVPIYVAALRERMLAARRRGRRRDDPQLPPARVGARRGRDDPPPAGHDVVCRFFCIPQPLHEGLPVARWLFAGYATVPVYEAFFRQLGWGTAIDPMVAAWRAGDRRQAAELAPEELLREVFVFGGPGAMRERLLEFAGAGVTTLCLMPLCAPDELPALIDGLA